MMHRPLLVVLLSLAPLAAAPACRAQHPSVPEASDPAPHLMSPRLYRVILPVSDIDAAAAFYAALLECAGERVSPGRHYFDLGGTILAVYDPGADGDALGEGWRQHANQYVYFAVDDLEAARERAQAAGAALAPEGIATMPWGERLFYARDPFQNPICLVDERTLFLGGGE